MTDIGEGVTPPSPPPSAPPCSEDSHVWEEKDSGKTADDQIDDLDRQIAAMSGSPSMAEQMRGLEFEKKAIQNNKDKLPIEACGKEYVCKKCGKNQEIDIAGRGRFAEAKSRNFKGVKKKSAQSKRLKSIQNQFFDPSNKPLAKIDKRLPDSDQSAAKYRERGFDVERLD